MEDNKDHLSVIVHDKTRNSLVSQAAFPVITKSCNYPHRIMTANYIVQYIWYSESVEKKADPAK